MGKKGTDSRWRCSGENGCGYGQDRNASARRGVGKPRSCAAKHRGGAARKSKATASRGGARTSDGNELCANQCEGKERGEDHRSGKETRRAPSWGKALRTSAGALKGRAVRRQRYDVGGKATARHGLEVSAKAKRRRTLLRHCIATRGKETNQGRADLSAPGLTAGRERRSGKTKEGENAGRNAV